MPTQQSTFCRQSRIIRLLLLMLATLLVLATPVSGAVGVRDFCCLVSMSDGVQLATDVYLPRFPKVVTRCFSSGRPIHGIKSAGEKARFACREGFGLVVQEVRGSRRAHPDTPLFEHDGWTGSQDGHTTIRWIASQGWCNGQVITWGPSAMGVAQNLLAPGTPAALRPRWLQWHHPTCSPMLYSRAAFCVRKPSKAGFSGNALSEKQHRSDPRPPLVRCVLGSSELHFPGQPGQCPTLFIGGWHQPSFARHARFLYGDSE